MVLTNDDLLRGQLVRLTGPRAGDAEVMARWSEDADYMRLVDTDWLRPHSADELALGRAGASHNSVEFRVRALGDDRLLGFVALHSIEWNNRVGKLSIGLGDPASWGQGYGTDALRLMLRFAFHEMNLDRLWLDVTSYNTRAIHTYEKLGFQHEGVLRSAVLRDGQHYDLVVMGMLRGEWERTR